MQIHSCNDYCLTAMLYVLDGISNEVQLDRFMYLWEKIQSVLLLDNRESRLLEPL